VNADSMRERTTSVPMPSTFLQVRSPGCLVCRCL
jgi:hypothetical protein